MFKIMNDKEQITQQKMTTTELQAPDLGQAHIECGGIWRRQPSPYLQSFVKVQYQNKIQFQLNKA